MYQNIIDPKNILNAFMALHIKNHLNCIFQKRLDMILNKILSKIHLPNWQFYLPRPLDSGICQLRSDFLSLKSDK